MLRGAAAVFGDFRAVGTGRLIMAHDQTTIGLLLAGAALTQAAAAPQVPMSDQQVVVVAVSSGLIGGVVSTLMAEVALANWREFIKRGLASGMIAPAIVAAAILYVLPAPTLLLVVAASGVAGLVAWPCAQLLPKLAPEALRNGIKRWLSAGGGA